MEPGIRAGVAFSFLSDRPNARFRGLASTIVLDGTLVSGIGTEGSRGKRVNLPPVADTTVIHRLSRAVAVLHLGENVVEFMPPNALASKAYAGSHDGATTLLFLSGIELRR